MVFNAVGYSLLFFQQSWALNAASYFCIVFVTSHCLWLPLHVERVCSAVVSDVFCWLVLLGAACPSVLLVLFRSGLVCRKASIIFFTRKMNFLLSVDLLRARRWNREEFCWEAAPNAQLLLTFNLQCMKSYTLLLILSSLSSSVAVSQWLPSAGHMEVLRAPYN